MHEKQNMINYYHFLNEKDLKKLLKRSRFFGFQTSFIGLAEPLFFIDYIFYRGINKSDLEDLSKLFDICIYQITQEHEMLGHMDIRIQNYFSKNKISSPNILYYDNNDRKISKEESDEFIELLLYDRYII